MRRLISLIVFACALMGWAYAAPTLAWEHDGANTIRFELIVDGGAAVDLGMPTPSGTTYGASLPTLAPGAHTLELRACNGTFCSTTTTLIVVVLSFAN